MDVKKLGRIPDGGGWRARGRSEKVRGRSIGFDYVHAAIDDHTRLAYAEIHPDEKDLTAAVFLLRAAAFFRAKDIRKIERVITDNAFAYRKSAAFSAAAAQIGGSGLSNPTAHEPTEKRAYQPVPGHRMGLRQPFTSNTQKAAALDPWLNYYDTERIHAALKATPIMRMSSTQ